MSKKYLKNTTELKIQALNKNCCAIKLKQIIQIGTKRNWNK